jgi:PAS domain S-box-containing protein
LAAGAILALVVVIGVTAVYLFVERQRERDLQAWQTRLGIVADSRAAAVNEWVGEQFFTLRTLAENASLQLYMTEVALARAGESELEVDDVEIAFLRNLLIVTATRSGFIAPVLGPAVDANVERVGLAGLALTDPQGTIVAATPSMPPSTPQLNQAIARAAAGEAALADMFLGVSDEPSIGFAVPVYAIQEDAGASKSIGLVVGLKLVTDELYDRLRQPGETLESAESYLVRENEAVIEYLSPLADDTAPLRRSPLAVDTENLAAAFVIEKPGGFAIRRDYKNDDVLVTGRKLAGVPWYLVRTVARAEALSEVEGRATTMYVVFLLIIVGVSVSLIAVWRHGTSVRAAQAAENYRITAERHENLTKFLRVVTDGQPNAITAVDGESKYTFANKAAADQAGTLAEDMLGKTMTAVIGPVKAKILERINRNVLDDREPASEVHSFEEADGVHIVKSDHIPLGGDRDHSPGVLVVLEDITELTRERARREAAFKQLVETLVGVVDRRDPYSAHHSIRVAEVARAIAEEMDLDKTDVETVEIAGNLLNLGKIVIPEELLTKTENLTEEERQTLHDSVRTSAEMVRGVEFDGPVVNILEQLNERWDGDGPLGLAREAIELGARIVAVANAFVGMASARAYRDAMPMGEASDVLMDQTGTVFDRRPVAALVNYIENRGGGERWAHFGEAPEAGAE